MTPDTSRENIVCVLKEAGYAISQTGGSIFVQRDCYALADALSSPEPVASPAEPWPEVREEDIGNLKFAAGKLVMDPTITRIKASTLMTSLSRILAVLEYARTHAQQAQEKGHNG